LPCLLFLAKGKWSNGQHCHDAPSCLEPREVVVRGKTQVISRSEESNAGMRNAERGIRNLQATWHGQWPVLGNSPAYSLNIPHSVFRIPYSSAS
jgi:nitroimidazol reductase NimA-like FMN-containing flavoprotein (pyridoxamine 5'-phosphate oxidase superfamily)